MRPQLPALVLAAAIPALPGRVGAVEPRRGPAHPSSRAHVPDACAAVPAPSEVDRPRPVLVCSPWLDWPEGVSGAEAVVELRALVAPDGRVREVRVEDADTDGRFLAAALANVRARRYLPATRRGAPVPAWVHARVVFRSPGAALRPRRG